MDAIKKSVFEQIGNLFYALAVDQHISALEMGEFKKILNDDWLTEQESGKNVPSEAFHIIDLTIDILLGEKIESTTAFRNFCQFYKKNNEVFSESFKTKILGTIDILRRLFPSKSQLFDIRVDQLKSLLRDSNFQLVKD